MRTRTVALILAVIIAISVILTIAITRNQGGSCLDGSEVVFAYVDGTPAAVRITDHRCANAP